MVKAQHKWIITSDGDGTSICDGMFVRSDDSDTWYQYGDYRSTSRYYTGFTIFDSRQEALQQAKDTITYRMKCAKMEIARQQDIIDRGKKRMEQLEAMLEGEGK